MIRIFKSSALPSAGKEREHVRMDLGSSYFAHNACDTFSCASLADDPFATEPLFAMKRVKRQECEEELHRLFEQAISDRVLVVSTRLKRISGPCIQWFPPADRERCTGSVAAMPSSGLLGQKSHTGRETSLPSQTLPRGLLMASFALFCLLIGFDLMGLLVLYMR